MHARRRPSRPPVVRRTTLPLLPPAVASSASLLACLLLASLATIAGAFLPPSAPVAAAPWTAPQSSSSSSSRSVPMAAASTSSSQEAPPRFTWIGQYQANLDDGAPMPAYDAGVLRPCGGSGSVPSQGSALAKLWTIDRRPAGGPSSGLAGLAGLGADATQAFLVGDAALLAESEVCDLILRTLSPSAAPAPAEGEMVSWVDSRGQDLLPEGSPGLSRLLVHRLNILHKGAGIFIVEKDGGGGKTQVFVHQRADHKRIFPSMHDMFVGGVSLHGETTEATARRELKEELNFGRPGAPFTVLYHCLIETSYNRCFVDVFQYELQAGEAGEAKLDPEEVQWGALVDLEEVKQRVGVNGQPGQWTFVPDGLLVWDALVAHWAAKDGAAKA